MLITDFTAALVVTVTFGGVLASVDEACLVHTRPRTPLPSGDWRRVQPATVLFTVLTVSLVVRKSTRVSPASTAPGTLTLWLVPLRAALAEATCETVPSAATAGAARPTMPAIGTIATDAARTAETSRFRVRAGAVSRRDKMFEPP